MITQSRYHYYFRKDFRYFHEPVPEELSGSWVVGRELLAKELADRIMLSRGGAFLVSGLRGVGKTTCVRHAIHLIRDGRERFTRLGVDVELVDVWINLARPLEPIQLLHLLIRHLYLRLKEARLLDRLDPGLREDLKTAFLRTSFEISSRSLKGEERTRGEEVGFGKAPWLGLEFLGKLSSSYKQSRSDEDALKYLPYDDKAAEFDILSFSRRLLEPLGANSTSRWRSWWQRIRRRGASQTAVKVLFVLDELDKLEAQDAQTRKSLLDPVLQALKSVFTASGLSFVFIGGKEVEERLLEDVSRGDSIYESIFAYDLYLPCLWKDQDDIVSHCFEPSEVVPTDTENTVGLYLRYKGRGIPRRTWRELNKHVVWDDRGPILTLDIERRRYMEVFAKAEQALQDEEVFRMTPGVVDQVQLDLQRLRYYYTIDWVFTRARETFNLTKLMETVSTFNLLGRDSELSSSEKVAESVVSLLLGRAFIESTDRERTLIGQAERENTYRLAPWVLLAFQGYSEKQRISEETVATPSPRARFEFERIGSFRVLQVIGEGGFAVVYKVADSQGRIFAAKVLRADVAARSPSSIELFERESEALRTMDHPGILRLYDSGLEQGRPYLIMDCLQGLSLRQVIDSLKKVKPKDACTIVLELSHIFGYIHRMGFVRLDIKPSNIFLTDDGETKVIDLGIASLMGDTSEGPLQRSKVVGTPGYMAPEQAVSGQADARADIFALGVVLYEMLTGQKPFRSDASEFDRTTDSDLPPIVSEFAAVPVELDLAIQKALARDPKDRIQTMDEFGRALAHLAEKGVSEVIKELRSLAQEGEISAEHPTRPVDVSVQMPTPVPRSAQGLTRCENGHFYDLSKHHSCPYCSLQNVEFDGTPAKRDSGRYGDEKPKAPEEPPDKGKSAQGLTRCTNGHFYDLSKHHSCPYCSSQNAKFDGIPAKRDAARHGGEKPKASEELPDAGQGALTDSIDSLIQLIRDAHSSVQESAFGELCRLSSLNTERSHLLFDLARKLCLWGGLDAHVSKVFLSGEPLKMGRNAATVQLLLDHPSISRQHIAFFPFLDAIEVEDLSTANGTFLNGKPCRRTKLSDGDCLMVGTCEIRLHILPRDRTVIDETRRVAPVPQ